MPKQRDFYTTEEAADELGVARRTIFDYINSGQLPNARKLDPNKEKSSYLIPVSDVEALKKKRAQSAKD